MSQEDTLLTRSQLAEKFEWEDNFPVIIQDRLYQHYLTYTHNGRTGLALVDIQSATDTLLWSIQGKPMKAFLGEHLQYFGSESTDDLKEMIDLLIQPLQTNGSE